MVMFRSLYPNGVWVCSCVSVSVSPSLSISGSLWLSLSVSLPVFLSMCFNRPLHTLTFQRTTWEPGQIAFVDPEDKKLKPRALGAPSCPAVSYPPAMPPGRWHAPDLSRQFCHKYL